jgi:hypothetical protein
MSEELSGRNPDGTFADGNTFSDGRNKYARQQELRQLFTDAVSHQDIQRLANKLTAMALDGDMQAAKLLLLTLFKEQAGPAVALQINQGSRAESVQKCVDIANRIRQQRERAALGFEQNAVIDLPVKQGAGE